MSARGGTAISFVIAVFATAQGAAQVKDEGAPPGDPTDLSSAQDCTEIQWQLPDGELLTRDEKIKLMDKILRESLNRVDPCQDGASSGSGSNDAGGGGGESGEGVQGEEGAADARGQAAAESTPAGGIQGDLPATETPRDDSKSAAPESAVAGTLAPPGNESNTNRKTPKDIPPAGNDDIIASQLRRAALDETDPAVQAKLWNEYRRYKGLPEEEAPASE